MKRVLLSLLTIGVVSATAIAGSQAFFKDREKSTGNTFTAGSIDLTIDSQCSYNGETSSECGDWDLKNLTSEKFFNFLDIKPGDWGENTISMHVNSNDAWACLTIDNMQNNENTCNDTELADQDPSCGTGTDQGELASNVYFTAWADNGNNIWEAGEPLLFSNHYGPASDVLNGKTYTLADSTTGNPIIGGTTSYIGLQWCFGAMQVDELTHTIACDGSGAGNLTQTDSLIADITFDVVQSKNNPTFRCVPEVHTMTLENKDPNYNRILNDGLYGVLSWKGDGETFDYTFEGYGLTNEVDYSLLYYADGWPGNNPGYYFGSQIADGSGRISMSGNPDLGMDLPHPSDANTTGAKIWLIPSSAYDQGTRSVTTWPFANDWLFESNLIKYDDTGI